MIATQRWRLKIRLKLPKKTRFLLLSKNFLILSTSCYPGWQADLDCKAMLIYLDPRGRVGFEGMRMQDFSLRTGSNEETTQDLNDQVEFKCNRPEAGSLEDDWKADSCKEGHRKGKLFQEDCM